MSFLFNKRIIIFLIVLFICCVVFLVKLSLKKDECIVHIQKGIGRGILTKSPNGFEFCSFFGISYAKPPIGKLRFEDPELEVPWIGTKSLTRTNISCPQKSPDNENLGTEDCLYLNVFAPLQKKGVELLPIFFWIHGGSFCVGSGTSDHNGPDFLVEENIIVVSINYRLGPLGFFWNPEAGINGNYGLKDQQMALKWVKENINNFGGDSNRVTIVGWSAGGSSVTYHLYSETSKGLFNQAISMSGTLINPWAVHFYPNECSQALSELLEIDYNDVVNLKSTLQTFDAVNDLLLLNIHLISFFFGLQQVCYAPTIDDKKSKNIFMKNWPNDLIKNNPVNDVPLMIGYTSLEMEEREELSFEAINPNYLNRNQTIIDEIYNFLNVTNFNEHSIFIKKLVSSSDMFHGCQKFTEIYSSQSNNNVYAYRFSFDGQFGGFKGMELFNSTTVKGAVHGDDLGYLFKPLHVVDENIDGFENRYSKELLTRSRMVELWSNFVKYG